MITKDILLADCILDLLDNCLDGARKVLLARNPELGGHIQNYEGFRSSISFDAQRFEIEDNCGGISIGEAIDYAFHFGRRPDAPAEADYSVGLYGIGMKRAIFKIGSLIDILSSTQREAFTTHIEVDAWLAKDDWDFDLDDADVIPATGTKIVIHSPFNPGIGDEFINPAFEGNLARIVGRDYSQFISKGFQIAINGHRIDAFAFTVAESDDFKPVRIEYEDEGVNVEIIAGMADVPPDDLEPTARRADPEYYGWFVLCNDRAVIASDKSNKTIWGDDGFASWHPQYNGFVGVLSFHARDPNLLPWTTTKRDIDQNNPVYRRAVVKMKEITRPWLAYTNDRKQDIDAARVREAAAVVRPLFQVAPRAALQVPRIGAARIDTAGVSYRKPTAQIAKVKTALGNANMSNREAGSRTFDYYIKNEVEE